MRPDTEELRHIDPAPADRPSGDDFEIHDLEQDAGGELWVATESGLFQLDREPDVLRPVAPCAGGAVYALASAPEGILWAGGDDALLRLDPRDGACETYRHQPGEPQSLSGSPILALHLDPNRELWIGTESLGLDRIALDRGAGAGLDGAPSFCHHRHQALVGELGSASPSA